MNYPKSETGKRECANPGCDDFALPDRVTCGDQICARIYETQY